MCIVRKLDGIMPLTRALGLCHLLTFGPVLCVLLMSDNTARENIYFDWFVLSQIYVISLCLLLDARDFFFYLAGYPYPCYIREGVRGGNLKSMTLELMKKLPGTHVCSGHKPLCLTSACCRYLAVINNRP